MEEKLERYDMTPLRGAAIGLVSGLKGGAVSGALGGGLLLLSSTVVTGAWRVMLFSLILGLTTGLMAGVIFGALTGLAAGALCGRLLTARPESDIRRVWLPLAAATTAGLGGWFYRDPIVLGLLIGGGLGLLAGRISSRDFARVSALQLSDDESEGEK